MNVILKDGWIQNDERGVLMDDRLLGHQAFSDLSFKAKEYPQSLTPTLESRGLNILFIFICGMAPWAVGTKTF